MIGIYKITNKVNNKVYIGQSSDIKRRWRDHRSAAFNPKDNGYNYPLYKAIRKYGLDNFSFDILEECSQSDINEREIFYIKEYNAHGSGGYNQDDGGLHAVHGNLDKNTVLEIHELLKQRTMTMTEIAQQYQVHKNTIKMINNGGAWIMENITYPIRTKAVSLSESRAMKNNPNGYVPTKDKKYFCCNCGAPLLSKKATLCPTCDKIRQGKYPLDQLHWSWHK